MSRYFRHLTSLGLAIAVASCSMAPQYERPGNPVAEQLQELDSAAGSKFAQVDWHEFYREPELRQLVGQALDNNRDLRLAALNVAQVQARYRIQRAELLPSLAATASAARQRVPESVSQIGGEYTTTQYSVGLGAAAWELDFFGRVNSLREGALQRYFASVEARRSAQLSLVAQVGETYFTWAANRALLDLATDTLARQRESFEVVKQRHERGLSSSLDVSQAATAVHSARVDIARYQRQLEESFTALELLVGAPLDAGQFAQRIVLDAGVTADVPAGLDSQVLLQRPDILQAEYQLRAANADIGAARAAFFPRIALTASAGSASNELDGLFSSGTGTWSFSPQISLPIFTWGSNTAALDVANLRKEASVAEYEQTIQVAFKEALDSIRALETLDAQFAAQQDLVQASEKSLELAKLRYERGVDSFLEVLVSQRDYNMARQGLVAVRLSQLQNKIALFRALGGGSTSVLADQSAETVDTVSEGA